jgi:hypothetical protein
MRRRIEALADEIEEFVGEDEHDALVVTCSDTGVAWLLGAIDALEQRGSGDLTLPLTDALVGGAALLAAVDSKLGAVCDAAGIGRITSGASAQDLVARAAKLCAHGTDERRARCILVACPSAVEDGESYATAVVALARAAAPSRCVRIVVRAIDGVAEALRRAALAAIEISVDVSATAIADALTEQADDPSTPIADRMALALSVALPEAVAGHAERALERLGQAEAHFANAGQPMARAVAVALAAYVLALEGDLAAARARMNVATSAAIGSGDRIAIILCATGAGDLAVLAEDFESAEPFFRLAVALACGALAPSLASPLLVRHGDALHRLGQTAEAHEAWLQSLTLARRAELIALTHDPAERLSALYSAAGRHDAAAAMSAVVEVSAAHCGCDGHHAGHP